MNKKFELNNIIDQIVLIDLNTINQIEQYGYKLDPIIIQKVDFIKTPGLSTHQIVTIFDDVIDELAQNKQSELMLFFEQFKTRYTYIDSINQSLDASVLNYEKESGNELLWPESFTTFYVGFFYFQMKKYTEEFLQFINQETFLANWNSTFYKNLIDELNKIIISSDVISQLELIEEWISKYNDPELLFNLIDFNYEENIYEKELFINKFNEFKLALQTLDLIVDLMARQVKELTVNG